MNRFKENFQEITSHEYIFLQFETSSNLDENLIYIDENLKISYSLKDKSYAFEIENISSRPIYVDVARSSLIVNKRALNYLKTLDSKERFYYIPSHSVLSQLDFKEGIPNFMESLSVSSVYTEETTPLSLRNQITYDFEEGFPNPILVENHIWLKEYNQSNSLPFSSNVDLQSPKVLFEDHLNKTSRRTSSEMTRKYSPGRTAGLFIPFGMVSLAGIIVGAILGTR
ncbi:hypothetical protein ACFLR1_01625 [Bacteroidota bacterium]